MSSENQFKIIITDNNDDTLSEEEDEVHGYKFVVPPIVVGDWNILRI